MKSSTLNALTFNYLKEALNINFNENYNLATELGFHDDFELGIYLVEEFVPLITKVFINKFCANDELDYINFFNKFVSKHLLDIVNSYCLKGTHKLTGNEYIVIYEAISTYESDRTESKLT